MKCKAPACQEEVLPPGKVYCEYHRRLHQARQRRWVDATPAARVKRNQRAAARRQRILALAQEALASRRA